jgi:hypothetical protein
MLGQFFGHGPDDFGTEMPEKRVPPGMEQAHEAIANQNEAGELEKSSGDEFLFHEIGGPKGCNYSSRDMGRALTEGGRQDGGKDEARIED